jgi:hypothetical protein
VIELLRRLALAGCVTFGVWLIAWCPPAVLSVRVADFQKEYAKKFTRTRERSVLGVMDLADEFLRENANPGSAAKYGQERVEGHLLKVSPAGHEDWLREVQAAGTVWYRPQDARIAPLWSRIRDLRDRTQYNAVYLPVVNGSELSYLELLWHSAPKDTLAPLAIVFPYRHQGWAWIALGLLAYLLIPGIGLSAGETRRDLLALGCLDLLAALFLGLLTYWPLYLSHTPGEAIDELVGLTGFIWAFAALMAVQLSYNAAAAAQRIRVDGAILRFRALGGERAVALEDISSVGHWDDGGQQKGLRLHLKSGGQIEIDWDILVDVGPLQAALAPLRSRT